MWLLLAFLSATLLGFYDSFKKKSLTGNAVITVLFLNTLFSTLIFLPFIVLSYSTHCLDGSIFHVASGGWEMHKWIVLKSVIVLTSWTLSYFGMKHVPLTIYGPINATRPVLVLLGAMLIYGERLNVWQWIGVLLAVGSFFMLSRSSKREGINFEHNVWIWCIALGALVGAASGLYDKFLMAPPANGGIGLDKMMVQSWYNFYQMIMMGIVLLITTCKPLGHRKDGKQLLPQTPFHWDWCIIFISVFLSAADFVYFYALSLDGAMISIVSMIRRGSVVVSFLFGAIFFHEKNLKAKAFDLAMVLLGMVFLYIGSK
ncbi:MAG: DMT family transporter [Prevotella sp.]|nr:DMT family transporter [Prevotella sp.]MDD7335328.1 DMT family transporter [Prevotella sp.]MDY4626549.1 DMT family transporter [Prevotella sp.]MDY4666601.1 DMT family transporter [Prevotella sp.]MDY5258408.1 DMT family transporter [Prevotella sp.]